jgi:hypothetical protein
MTATFLALGTVLVFGAAVFWLGLRAADQEREERLAARAREKQLGSFLEEVRTAYSGLAARATLQSGTVREFGGPSDYVGFLGQQEASDPLTSFLQGGAPLSRRPDGHLQ